MTTLDRKEIVMGDMPKEKSVTEICDWLEKSVERGFLPDEAAIPKVMDAARRADLVEVDVREIVQALEECQRLLINETESGECLLAKPLILNLRYLLEQGHLKAKNK